MKPRNYSSEGIVLARKNCGEADRIVVIYSKHFGKLRLLAKGVRRPKSRKRGHIEVFSRLKFQVSRGKGMDLITEAEIIQNFSEIRKSLKKVTVAYFFMEATGRVTHDEEKNEPLYELILLYMGKLQFLQGVSLKKLRSDFVYDCLVLLGFWPKGKIMTDSDRILAEIAERDISTIRVGKKLLT